MRAPLVAAGIALMAGPVFSADELPLAQKSGCMACHSIDKKLVGPSYKDVAQKYAGDAGAGAKLVGKVRQGGSGVWGQTPMPPNPTVKEEDLKKLMQWILSLK